MIKSVSRILYLLFIMIWMGICASSIYYVNAAPGVTSTPAVAAPTPVPAIPSPVETKPNTTVPPTVDTRPETAEAGWSLVQPGLERRVTRVYNEQNQHVESVHVWRLDQNYFRLDVAYDETPRSLESWQRATSALMVVDGGYYSIANERYFPDGLTIVNGRASGRSFRGYGGMLAIKDDRAELRWLVQKPYNASEPLQAALQSFPVLVRPGGELGFGAERENNVSARRTVIGQDKHGRILFIVAPQGYFTLHQLSVYLTESDLNLDIAVNLDGGGSTGILVANPPEVIPPNRPLPFVILVYAR
jgi:Phosphodiester glycosidase